MKVGKIGEVGEVVITRLLAAAQEDNAQMQDDIKRAWEQYIICNWGGILGEEDKALNDNAVKNPKSDRILARYKTCKGDIYIITEWDRSYTTLLFCNEY